MNIIRILNKPAASISYKKIFNKFQLKMVFYFIETTRINQKNILTKILTSISNGLVERTVRAVRSIFRKYVLFMMTQLKIKN
jgi:hypothetical protein